MHSFLKQSTASQSRSIGPFLSDSDFVTAQTGLTIANTDIKLMVNGAASANKNSGGGTHRVNGVYGITFDATDTATVGELFVSVKVSGALPVFATFVVIEEAVYDMLFAATALGYIANAPVNVAQFGGSNGTFASGRPEVNTTLIEGSDATNQIRDSIVDDATRIDASALNTLSSHDPGEAIMGATDLGTGAGLTTLATQASVNDLPTNAELATALGTADDAVLAAIAALNNLSAAQVNAEVDTAIADAALATAANLATVDGNVDAIKAKTDSLTFTVAGQVDANITYVNGTGVTGDGHSGTEWGPA